jgi:hypothetical protein
MKAAAVPVGTPWLWTYGFDPRETSTGVPIRAALQASSFPDLPCSEAQLAQIVT